jgi:SPP1 gp7 family putative phage head morphogenesis protein
VTTAEPFSPDLRRALRAAATISTQLAGRLLALTRRRDLSAGDFLARAARLIESHTPMLEQTLRDALLSAYLRAARGVVRIIPAGEMQRVSGPPGWEPPPPDVPDDVGGPGPNEPEPIIRFPMIEAAVADLANRRLVDRAEFDALDQDARRAAFTVARLQEVGTIGAIRDAVVEDVQEGGSRETFRQRVRESLGASPISKHHLENVYRTNVAQAYSAGQRDIIQHPVVMRGVPYVRWISVHDRRVRTDHLAMETAGIEGTSIFRLDDPILQRIWPPASYQCRCHLIMMDLRSAARYITEARQWLETGQPPAIPTWIESVPIQIPPGWVSAGGGIRAVA